MKFAILTLILISSIGHANAARVLFIGNSFTGFTMATVKRFETISPLGPHQFQFEFVGGITLQGHSSRVETLKAVQCQRFDYVVMQDHSMRTLNARQSFEFEVTRLTEMARESGAQPMLFQTWARGRDGNLNGFLFDQNIVSNAYLDIGSRLNVPVIRIGDAWREVRNTNLSLFNSLYLPDLIHPTPTGEYIAAASIYRAIYPTDLAWLSSFPGDNAQLAGIRGIVNRLNPSGSPYTNPNSESVCDTSRDEEQRDLCGCGPFKEPPRPLAGVLSLLLE